MRYAVCAIIVAFLLAPANVESPPAETGGLEAIPDGGYGQL